MNVTFDNTRALGVGETVLPSDYYVVVAGIGERGEILPITQPEVGKIIADDEVTEYRRLLSADPYEAMIAELGLETEMGRVAFRVACENVKLLDRKHSDYGPGNIAAFGEFGITVRLSDKVERLKNLMKMQTPKNESLEDTFVDVSNYGLLGQLVLRKLWR